MPKKTKEELLLIVNTVLKNGGREALDALPLDADLRSDIGFDSFDLAELAVRIQAKFDVDVFEDEKIIQLVDRLGLNAFVVFFAVCQRAYGARGYYLPWPAGEAVMIRRALGSEVTGQYISDVVDLGRDLGLFHADTFAQYGVLTSRAIQRNFVVVLQRRRRKEVFRGIWLLSEAESGSAVLVDANEDDF